LVVQDGNVGIESIRANIESLEAKALHMFGFEAFIDVLYLAAQTLAVQTRFVWLQQTLAVQTRFVWLQQTLAVQTRFVWLQQTLAVQTRFVWLHKH
jgi:hypothetical protein